MFSNWSSNKVTGTLHRFTAAENPFDCDLDSGAGGNSGGYYSQRHAGS